MDRRTFVKSLPALTLLADAAASYAEDPPQAAPEKPNAAQDLPPVVLEKPQTDGGKSVLAALQERRTIRDISAEKLSPQTLSNLLWAAFGVNRRQGPFGQLGRTAASASNSQEIDLYVALPEAIYLYEADPHRLLPVVGGDLRGKVNRRGRQGAGRSSRRSSFSSPISRNMARRGFRNQDSRIPRFKSPITTSPRALLPETFIYLPLRKGWRPGSIIATKRFWPKS